MKIFMGVGKEISLNLLSHLARHIPLCINLCLHFLHYYKLINVYLYMQLWNIRSMYIIHAAAKFWLIDWFLVFTATFQQYFSYMMATSFNGGRSQSSRREPPTMGKKLVNFITCRCESSAPFFIINKAGCKRMPYC